MIVSENFNGLTRWVYHGDPSRGMPGIFKLIPYLRNRGWEVHLLYLGSETGDSDEVRDGIWFHRRHAWGETPMFIRLSTFARATLECNRLVRRIRPHLLYGTGYLAMVTSLSGRLNKIPVVSRLFGTFLHHKLNERPLWRILLDPKAMMEVGAFKAPASSLIVTDDGTAGDKVAKRLGVARRLHFWRNGVDLPREYSAEDKKVLRERWNIPPGNPIILTTCRLAQWKRVDLIVQAMPGVLQQLPNACLIIAGDGPQRTALQELAGSLGVLQAVRFLGSRPHDEILALLQIAEVYVSVYAVSNVGNALLEAMAAGCAIVAANTGETHRYVQDDVSGILLPEDNLNALDEAVVDILVHPDKHRRLGQGARRVSGEHFPTWEERLAQEAVLLESLLPGMQEV